ncbi:MAG TPA: NAD(P)H-hydrate dehydratase [Kofleriaceae bacterium]|nr:NAD(P)H-hydrate dehydratase [Kofleriaceae bacterium]
MHPVVTAAEMRALDRATMELGIPAFTLMETAGRAVAKSAIEMLGGQCGPVAVVCGAGNNGGDGYVVARVLRSRGIDATVYLAASRDALVGAAAEHLGVLERTGGVVLSIATREELEGVEAEIGRAMLVVDALFGVGLSRAIEGHLAAVVHVMRRAARVLAIDIPSGLHADTGRAMGPCVSAERTVTMAAMKVALASAPGFAACGEIEVVDIGVPPQLIAATAIRAGLVEPHDVRGWLPRPQPLDHKGRRGHAVVVGGAPGMRGAGRLAATAALRAGAGLVTLASDDDPAVPDSIMTMPADGALERFDAIVIGPGLGKSAEARDRVEAVLASGIPAVLDADALNLFEGRASDLTRAAGPLVLTPHPGEAARLLGCSTADIEADRLAAARSLASRTRAVVVLKGARTIVCDGTIEDDHCTINPTGGPALATAGSGDVLAGTIGALLAQRVTAGDAARAGVYVHGAAGDALAAEHGMRGVISSDLPLAIARAIAACD